MNRDSTYVIPSFVDCAYNTEDAAAMRCEQKCELPPNVKGSSFFSTDLFANLVSTGALLITLIIFIIQSKQARKEQRRTINENWYLTIILQPNMDELDEFYIAETTQLETQINKLKGRHGKETTEKARSIKVLRDLKNDFFNHFILMIQGYDVTIAQKADDILGELADYNSECIDNYKKVGIADIKRRVYENKAKLIDALYQGISKDSRKKVKYVQEPARETLEGISPS